MDQHESTVQPINQWGYKEGRQVNCQRTPINRSFPLILTLTAWKVVTPTSYQRLIFEVQKRVEALI
jgi:hypothetical protein